MRTRIKICGITRAEDAHSAAEAGADAIGLVFYPPSKRAVTIEKAADILNRLPALVSTVGLFVNASEAEVRQVLSVLPLQFLQFHGSETPEYCASFGRPWLKALRLGDGGDDPALAGQWTEAGASALLLDTFEADTAGGTGQTFDWSSIPQALRQSCILAGGLHAENVGEAMARIGPLAVDVSSGVEAAAGIKDPAKIRAFVNAVQLADRAMGE